MSEAVSYFLSFLAAAIPAGMPLLYGTLGEILTEKGGNLNLGVEGMMYMGAIFGFVGGYYAGSVLLMLLLASLPNRFYERLIVWRRDLVALHACYDQLSSMGESLRASTSPLIQEEDRLAFGYLSDRAERFLQHVESLREDLLHIREMYQTQIGVRQSRVMTMLAVISAIFLPLTLLVGWYGMNFAYMPELHWAYGYPVVIALSVVIVVVEIVIFRHNRWL